jgi:hypothetical protein
MSVGFQNNGSPGDPQRSSAAGAEPADWNTLKEDVSEIASEAVERGRTFVDSAKAQATDYVDRRKSDAAQSVADFARSIRETRRSFEDRPNIAAFFDSAAEGLDRLSGTIRERSFAEMFNDVEVVMRRRPTLVAAAGLTTGFLLARFVKASAQDMRGAELRDRTAGPRRAGQRVPPPYGGQGARNRDFRGQDI